MKTDDVVSALAYSFAQAHAEPGRADLQAPYNDLARFIVCQQARLPDYLRTPMRAATLGFDLAGLVHTGQLFHAQPPANRRRQAEAWKNSRLGFRRDLMRYYESLAILALYSRRVEGPESRPPALPAPGPTECRVSSVECRTETNPRALPGPMPAEGVISAPARELRCAIAVVGSGPGGAITACLLAEAGRDVLLIEEGPFYSLESCPPFSKEEMLLKYRNGGQTVAMGANKVAYVEGCCVGGGSEINSGLYHRAPPEILELWRRQFKVSALTEADLRPHFEACEREVSVSLLPGAAPAASLKLQQGASRLGWKSLEAPRWFRYGPGKAAGGERQSMTRTFVPRLLEAGGKLLPQTRIERLRRQAGKWLLEGRHAARGGVADRGRNRVLVRRRGADPGPPAPQRHHPQHRQCPPHAPYGQDRRPVPGPRERRRPGRAGAPGQGICAPAQFRLLDQLTALPGPGHDRSPLLGVGCPPGLDLHGQLLCNARRPGARHRAPLPGFRDPLVRYRLSEQDRRDLAEGHRKLAEVLFAAGAVALYPGLVRGPRLLSPDDLRQLPEILPNGLAPLMTVHLFSSCPMGEDQHQCATDSFGRVHGLDNLFVNDASLLCTAPGVNPQGSIMALARRNTLHFLGC